MIKYLLVFSALVGSAFAACSGSSPTLTAASASRTDVAACVTLAVSGDTINVPSGSATWASEISFTKAIHLAGAGLASTTLTCSSGCVAFAPSAGEETKVFEVNGFHFIGAVGIDETGWGHTPAITGLKIHDNNFTGASSGRAIWLAGLEFGVFYSNSFSGNFIDMSVIGASMNGNFFALCFGCSSYPYFEDNSIGNGVGAEFVSETGQGGRMVWRHNTITGYDSGGGSEVFDLHGEQNSGGWTATSEYYHNTVGTLSTPFRWMNHRGGQAIIINNAVTKSTGGSLAFEITEFQDHGGNGICNNYPIAYNSSEAYCSPVSGSCLETQPNNSFYAGNTMNGSPQDPSLGTPGGGSCGASPPWGDTFYIIQNREYWLPSSGLASARPATCTANGNTYYDATDTDVIYKCTSTNTWTVFYQPYTYPHPLRSSSCTAGSSVSTCASSSISSGAASLARKLRKMSQPKAQ